MHLTIDNHDYTAALDAASPLSIERTLNAPSVCRLSVTIPPDTSLTAPARFQRVSISGDDGTVYFTGYIASTPQPEYAGLAMEGPRYRFSIYAISDEVLLDQALASSSMGANGLSAGALLANFAAHTGSGALSTSGLALDATIGHFAPDPGAPFSKSAGQIAFQARSAYRAHSGKLTLCSIPAAVHTLNESDGSLTLANLAFTRNPRRDFANDITVFGEREAAVYVTEIFRGDGVTNEFNLSESPFFPPASKANLISEQFNEPGFDTRFWGNSGGGTYFTLGASGLTMSGGSGIDGQSQLAWLDPVELAGTLLLEAQGVTLANASAGLLAAFFDGGQDSSSCLAGFQATAQQGTGAVTLQPIVFGCGAGATYTISPAKQYALRVRIHCPEEQRARTIYRSFGDSGIIGTGGQLVSSPAKLHFEIQEFVNGVASIPVTLYDGVLANAPADSVVVAVSSVNLHGSMRALTLTSLGSAWVKSTPQNGGPFTRRVGSATESAECAVSRSGKLAFYTGFTPAQGEQISVSYRTTARSVGRSVNIASQHALQAQGLPAVASWLGSVTSPPCRSSADCRHAADALAQSAGSSTALWSGTYRGAGFGFASDVWPGDALALDAPSCGLNAQLVVRAVKVTYSASVPDLFIYEIAFANDWAEDLAIRTGESVPADVWLPSPVAPLYAPNLNALTVAAIAGKTVTINTGATAPTGGGFEIRSRDYAFMPGEDPSLVMRGSQPNLTFTRQSATDRFYIRMFDGADPPNYSEFSAALFVNLPLNV